MTYSDVPMLLADTHLHVQKWDYPSYTPVPLKKMNDNLMILFSQHIYLLQQAIGAQNQENLGFVNNCCFENFTKYLPGAQRIALTNPFLLFYRFYKRKLPPKFLI